MDWLYESEKIKFNKYRASENNIVSIWNNSFSNSFSLWITKKQVIEHFPLLMSWLLLKKYKVEITVITLNWNIIYVFKIFRKNTFHMKHKLRNKGNIRDYL